MTIERVAVIGGTGDEGFALAKRWAKAGIEVTIGSRDANRGEQAAQRLSDELGRVPTALPMKKPPRLMMLWSSPFLLPGRP